MVRTFGGTGAAKDFAQICRAAVWRYARRLVETQTVTPESRTRDPLAGFDLDSLLSGGARVRPQRIALSDGALDAPSALTFADLDAFVSRTAAACSADRWVWDSVRCVLSPIAPSPA